MADQRIVDLPAAQSLTDAGLLVVYQSGQTQSLTGAQAKAYVVQAAEEALSPDIAAIQGLIPAEASATNQLADRDYVDDNSGKIDVIKKNGTALPIDSTDKSVNITVPTALSDLTGDSTHRVVTDAEKSAWNGKQAAISDLSDIRSGAALGATAIQASAKGANNGVAELDSGGKVPSSQLPSYVDDVLEYSSQSTFPATGESGKIYIATDTNRSYRWSGTTYVEISSSLALGETSSTAYRGDRGKTAYDHSQTTGNPHGTTAEDVGAQEELVSGTNIKTINNQSILGSGDLTVSGLPAYTSADNGKFLMVDNGAAAWTTVPQYQGGSY